MPDAILKFSPYHVSEFFRLDQSGKWVENSPERWFVVRPELRLAGKSIKFRIDFSAPRSHLKEDPSAASDLAFRSLCSRYPLAFSNRQNLRLIGANLVNLSAMDIESPVPVPEKPSGAFDYPVIISENLANSVIEQWEMGRAANKKFRTAVDRLNEIFGEGLQAVKAARPELYSLLSFIEACIRVGDVGHLTAWYDEKLSVIRNSIEDLSGRKNPNHPSTHSSLERARSPLYSFRDIEIWTEEPPSSYSVDQYLDNRPPVY